ncbi:chain-length determining protein, partial [Xanthomonas citri pv. citri]|nr:chain-length determining protein [Xanthomonas citri pv. citri]
MSSLPSEPTVAQSGSSAIEREGTTDSSTQPPRPRNPGQPIDLLGFLKGLGHHWLA